MRRRDFLTVMGGVVAAWPLTVLGQQLKQMPRIGLLLSGDEMGAAGLVQAFKTGMVEHGYQENKNVRFEARYADPNREKLTRNAHDLAAANVDVIWVPGSGTAAAAHAATTAIPIVFALVSPRFPGHKYDRTVIIDAENMGKTDRDLIRNLWNCAAHWCSRATR